MAEVLIVLMVAVPLVSLAIATVALCSIRSDDGLPDYHSYHCRACGKIVSRDSRKLWIRSWCSGTSKFTRLWRIR